MLAKPMPPYQLRLHASQDPLTPALSQQARLGELATQRCHIRSRIWRGEGAGCGSTPKVEAGSSVLSPLGERDRVRGSCKALNRTLYHLFLRLSLAPMRLRSARGRAAPDGAHLRRCCVMFNARMVKAHGLHFLPAVNCAIFRGFTRKYAFQKPR